MSPIVTLTNSGAQQVRRPKWVAPDVPPDAFVPNRPAGFSTIADLTFDDTFDNSNVSVPTSYSYQNWTFTKFAGQKTTVVSDATAPNQTGETLAVKWLNGQGFGYGSRFYPSAYTNERDHIFIAFTFKPSSAFVYEDNGYKVFYPTMRSDGSTGGNNASKAYLGIRSAPDSVTGGRCQLTLEQFFRWSGSQYNQFILYNNQNGYTSSAPYWLNNDAWYRIEMEWKVETPNIVTGPQDGIVRVWVSAWNGSAWGTPTLTMQYTDVRTGGFTATTSKVFAAGINMWDYYRGGAGTPTLTADQFLYMDRLHLSTGA